MRRKGPGLGQPDFVWVSFLIDVQNHAIGVGEGQGGGEVRRGNRKGADGPRYPF